MPIFIIAKLRKLREPVFWFFFGPESGFDLLLRCSSAFGEAPAGVGHWGCRRLKLRGMLRIYVAGPRLPGNKARVT